jgi:hypothetical protein
MSRTAESFFRLRPARSSPACPSCHLNPQSKGSYSDPEGIYLSNIDEVLLCANHSCITAPILSHRAKRSGFGPSLS